MLHVTTSKYVVYIFYRPVKPRGRGEAPIPKYKPCGTLLLQTFSAFAASVLQLVAASLPQVYFSYAHFFSGTLFLAHFWHTLAAYFSYTVCCKCTASIPGWHILHITYTWNLIRQTRLHFLSDILINMSIHMYVYIHSQIPNYTVPLISHVSYNPNPTLTHESISTRTYESINTRTYQLIIYNYFNSSYLNL
jgi:hypothetical protein